MNFVADFHWKVPRFTAFLEWIHLDFVSRVLKDFGCETVDDVLGALERCIGTVFRSGR